MTDRKLLARLIARAEADPALLRSAVCRDEDGQLCLPALAADLSGGRWAASPGEELGQWLLAEGDDNPADVLRIIHPHDRARRLLHTRRDLGQGLTLADLKQLL